MLTSLPRIATTEVYTFHCAGDQLSRLHGRSLGNLCKEILNDPDSSARRLPGVGRVHQSQVKVAEHFKEDLVHLHKGQTFAQTLPSAGTTKSGGTIHVRVFLSLFVGQGHVGRGYTMKHRGELTRIDSFLPSASTGPLRPRSNVRV
jgi:hypothetical protein